MIRNYPIALQTDDEEGRYSLMLGPVPVASITPDEPMTGADALRVLLGIETKS